ncbi:MAG: DUF302 domain-containing protein [Gammaproteobacteria bacterium]
MMLHKLLIILTSCLWLPTVLAQAPVDGDTAGLAVYEKTLRGDFNKIYQQVFTALETNGYFVVFEPNIGKQLERFKQRWGDKYNQNGIENIKALVFCNAWYANEVSNQQPKLLALCPMHITLTEKQGMVSLLYIRPSVIARGTAAEKLALEIEQDVVRSIEEGLSR